MTINSFETAIYVTCVSHGCHSTNNTWFITPPPQFIPIMSSSNELSDIESWGNHGRVRDIATSNARNGSGKKKEERQAVQADDLGYESSLFGIWESSINQWQIEVCKYSGRWFGSSPINNARTSAEVGKCWWGLWILRSEDSRHSRYCFAPGSCWVEILEMMKYSVVLCCPEKDSEVSFWLIDWFWGFGFHPIWANMKRERIFNDASSYRYPI